MLEQLQLTITTPLETVYQDTVEQVTVTTTSGEITILAKHVPLISQLKMGHVMIKKDGETTYFAIDGGLLEVRQDHSVVILSDRSEHADSLDIEALDAAIAEAKEYLENPETAETNYAQLEKTIAREQNRAQVARRGGRK